MQNNECDALTSALSCQQFRFNKYAIATIEASTRVPVLPSPTLQAMYHSFSRANSQRIQATKLEATLISPLGRGRVGPQWNELQYFSFPYCNHSRIACLLGLETGRYTQSHLLSPIPLLMKLSKSFRQSSHIRHPHKYAMTAQSSTLHALWQVSRR